MPINGQAFSMRPPTAAQLSEYEKQFVVFLLTYPQHKSWTAGVVASLIELRMWRGRVLRLKIAMALCVAGAALNLIEIFYR